MIGRDLFPFFEFGGGGFDGFQRQFFGALVDSAGAFSAEIPLRAGENQLTVIARDLVGNEAQKGKKVTLQLSELPSVIILSPPDGATLSEEKITVSGIVHSTLEPEQIRLVLNDQIQFPTGSGGEYTYYSPDNPAEGEDKDYLGINGFGQVSQPAQPLLYL